MYSTYLITLDAHEYFGPFSTKEQAHYWAYKTGRTSYMLTTKAGLPKFARIDQPRLCNGEVL